MADVVLDHQLVAADNPRTSYGEWGLRATAISYLGLFILVPLFVVTIQGVRFGLDVFWESVSRPQAVSTLVLSIWTSALMALINSVMGTLTAFVLVRYRFRGKAIFNTLIDLPFAIPTLVTGVMLVVLYGPQTPIGGFFAQQLGFRIIFGTPSIVIALLFVGYPFVVRTVQPVLMQIDAHQMEAAHTIGATEWRTFWRVIFPGIQKALITGGMLSFARSLGEFGAVVVVSGNIPMRTQTATVYIYSQVEAGNMQAASSVSMMLLLVAFAVTLGVDWLQRKQYA